MRLLSARSGWPTVILGLAVPIVVCSAIGSPDADDNERLPAVRETTDSRDSKPLRLSEEQQRTGGIAVMTIQRATLSPENAVQGKIVDISSLLELRTRYRGTLAESRIAETALGLAQKNRDRLARLSQEAIIATKDLVLAESMLAADRTRAATAGQRLREIREEALHSWGPELFRLAIAEDSSLWEALVKRQKVLALIALPANTALPAGTRSIYIARNRDRQHAVKADMLAAAPNTDNLVQGETYFYHLDAARLRTGMRVDAWIPLNGQTATGAFLPASAIVWYGGMPWVYLQSGPDTFRRIAITDYDEYGDGWFVRTGFHGGEQLVSVGAQLLLSEEMRGQIPREADD